MKSRALKCARHYVINHTCQARSPRSRKLSLSAVACFSLVSGFLSFLCVFWSSVCVWVCLWVISSSFPRRVSHQQYLMWALIRGEELPNMLATCWLRSHTQGPPLIFHREEERDAYIILTEPEWRETSLCYLHTHTQCQRFIVQGFNGALTHLSLSLSLYTSLSLINYATKHNW